MSAADRQAIVRDLKERLQSIERAHGSAQTPAFSSGIDALDQLLPAKGLEWGTLIEWLSEGEGSGAAVLALAITANVLQQDGALVVIDSQREFYPPAAARLGILPEYTVLVRPQNARDALWALEQALRSRAVAVALSWVEELNSRTFRRLQLAAETGGNLGFLLRPATYRTEPSWAEVRFLVKTLPSLSLPGWRLSVELLHCRGGAGGKTAELELSDDADIVRLASPLADSAFPPGATGAS